MSHLLTYIYIYNRARRTVATRDGGHRRWDTTEGLIYSGKGMGMMEGGSNSITWIKVASKSGGAGWVGRGELANHCHVSQCVWWMDHPHTCLFAHISNTIHNRTHVHVHIYIYICIITISACLSLISPNERQISGSLLLLGPGGWGRNVHGIYTYI